MTARVLLAILLAAGAGIGVAASMGVPSPSACTAIDGDTFDCAGERVRLMAIDAPELPGHCRRNRICAPGDPYASKANAAAMLLEGDHAIIRSGKDRYGRTIGDVMVIGANGNYWSVSCRQLNGGFAIYKPRYDKRRMVKGKCNP